MGKKKLKQTSLFIDAHGARVASQEIVDALAAVRAAKRYMCKAESIAGQEAHRNLQEAEAKLEQALEMLGAVI